MSDRIIVAILSVDELKCKKCDLYILMRKIINIDPIKIFNQPKVIEYYDRVRQYNHEREYDDKIKKLYFDSKVKIDGVLYPIDMFYITFKYETDNHNFHLMNIKSEYNDILINSMESYDFDGIVPFRNTTAFINLINSGFVTIDYDKNIITINNKEKVLEIINNWDGMIHNKVAETDAINNKDFLKI